MSYDFDDYPPTLPPLRRWWQKPGGWYWSFVIWAALDARSEALNRWGLRRLRGP